MSQLQSYFRNYLYLAPIFLYFASLGAIYNNLGMAGELRNYTFFIANFLFLDIIHLGFSFIVIGVHPAFKSAYLEKLQSKFFKLGLLAVFLISCLIFVFKFYTDFHHYAGAIISLLALHHGWAQSNGLLKIRLHQKKLDSDQERTFLIGAEIFQKIVISIAWFGFLLVNVFPKIIFADDLSKLQNFIFVCIGTMFFAWISLQIYFSKKSLSNKGNAIFFVRYLLIGLVPFSLWATVAQKMVHGFEYLYILSFLFKDVKLTKKQVTFIASVLIFFTIYSLVLFLDNFFPAMRILLLLIIFEACSVFHYYLDRISFKLRDDSIRGHVLPYMKRIVF